MGKLKVAFHNFTNAPKLEIKTLSEAKRVLFGVQCKKKQKKEGRSKLEDHFIFRCTLQQKT
jgi:hypothetical protein